MLKNDFRRSLILLRPLRRGMSGHVRLERRTLQGSMRFTVQGAAQGKLHALLMAQGGNGWTVYKLGALTADSRGQSGLNATFDPRNLQGLDLNQYTLVVLVDDGPAPEMVMSGLVNGSKEIDWAGAARAATAPYQKVSKRGQIRLAQEAVREQAEQEVALAEAAEEALEQAAEEVVLEEAAEEAVLQDALTSGMAEAQPEVAIVEEVAQAAPVEEVTCCCDDPQAVQALEEEAIVAQAPAVELVEVEQPPQQAAEPAPEEAPRLLACQVLELDLNLDWPEDIAAIKPLFENGAASDDFALDDFVFVNAPLPSPEGTQGVCAIGLRAKDAAPVSVCYALPGDFALDPPPGLEGYQYLGGWWYTVLDVAPETNALGEELVPE